MWVKDIYIDGYGIFRDFCVKDMAPGLNVFFGPNEAGKTTLMHFLNCILFGFERQSAAEDFHEPLQGGEHGGRVVIVTEAGQEYVVARHTTKKNTAPPVVTGTNGLLLDEKDFQNILGNLSKKTYVNIFSFGIDELNQISTLEGSELEAQLYSAGYIGRGRSVAEVAKYLETERNKLWKLNSKKNRISELVTELTKLTAEINQFKQEPQEYIGLLDREVEISRVIKEQEKYAQECMSQVAHYTNIQEIWPTWLKLQELEREVQREEEALPQTDTLLAIAGEIQGLNFEVPSLLENLEELDRTNFLIEQTTAEIERGLRNLGVAWTIEEVQGFPTDRLTQEQVRSLAKEVATGQLEVKEWQEKVNAQRQVVQERVRSFQECSAELQLKQEKAEDKKELSERRRVLAEAANLLEQRMLLTKELNELDLRLESLDRERQLLERTQVSLKSNFGLYLFWLGLISAGVITSQLGQNWSGILTVAGVFGLLYVVISHRQQKRDQNNFNGAVNQRLYDELQVRREELSQQNQEVGHQLTICSVTLLGEMTLITNSQLAQLREDLARSEQLQETVISLQDQCSRTNQLLSESQRELQYVEKCLSEAIQFYTISEKRWQELLASLRLPVELDLDGTLSFFGATTELQNHLQTKVELSRKLKLLQTKIDSTRTQIGKIQSKLDLPISTEYSQLSGAISTLHQWATKALEIDKLRAERNKLWDRIVITVGDNSELTELDQPQIAAELANWQKEQMAAQTRLDQLKAELGVVRDRIQGLEKTVKLAARELDYNLRLEDLQRVTAEWLKFRISAFLLDKAKERYEQEKQPAVLAAASNYFEQVTAGRYRRLLKPLDAEGILVETVERKRLQPRALSRGTLEELYLCLRLALVRNFGVECEPLPLIMDDVLVNMDEQRFQEACTLVAKVAEEQQVFFFTCHPRVAAALYRQAVGSNIFHLGGGKAELESAALVELAVDLDGSPL